GIARTSGATRGPVTVELTVAEVQDGQADRTEASALAGNATARADSAVRAGAAGAPGGPVVGERAVGDGKGGSEADSEGHDRVIAEAPDGASSGESSPAGSSREAWTNLLH